MRAFDTHGEAHDVQMRAYRQMTPARRGEIALEMSEGVRDIARSGIRGRHPDYSDEQVRRALITLLYGRDTARRIWPNDALVLP